MALRLISLVLFFLSLINYSLWRDERTARKLLEEEIISTQPDARASLRPESLQDAVAEAHSPAPAEELPSAIEETKESATPTEELPTVASVESAPLSEMALYGIESRISAIEKFVPLSDEQRLRLREKYTQDAIARRSGTPASSESLEAIVGQQSADFYKQQLASAFQKSQEQEMDREIYYLSRKLTFTASQEARMRELMAQVENEAKIRFEGQRNSPEFAQDASYRVRLMMQENQFKSEWLATQLKETLTTDQYQAYLQEEAESSSAELGIWHAP